MTAAENEVTPKEAAKEFLRARIDEMSPMGGGKGEMFHELIEHVFVAPLRLLVLPAVGGYPRVAPSGGAEAVQDVILAADASAYGTYFQTTISFARSCERLITCRCPRRRN